MLAIKISTIIDGSMKSPDLDFRATFDARRAFLQQNDINPNDTTLVNLVYTGDDYTRYFTIDNDTKGDGITRDASIIADALVVTKPHHALFLPLADCVGAVIHDPTLNILMLSHLGRHNLEQHGGTRSINYLVDNFGSNPHDVTVWLSPAAGSGNYPLYSFNNRGMHDIAIEQLLTTRIPRENITVSPIDTTTSIDYFSHSQFLVGNRDTDGRHAVVAVMRQVLDKQ